MKKKKSIYKSRSMLYYENKYYQYGYKTIAGVDEVGRGCWAGPVVAACVILPKDYKNDQLKDSKTLSAKKRQELAKVIRKNALAIGIDYCTSKRIDETNIKAAAIEAMYKAIDKMQVKPKCVLVDAEKLKNKNYHTVSIVKGDALSQTIAAASIIAKVYRDQIYQYLHQIYPQYGFDKHKGYGTKLHIDALKKYGPIKNVHRFSFKPIKLFISKD